MIAFHPFGEEGPHQPIHPSLNAIPTLGPPFHSRLTNRSQAETCGGRFAFSLYQLLPMPPASRECSGDPVKVWGQCGGNGWTGSTCCEDGLECRAVDASARFSQVSKDDQLGEDFFSCFESGTHALCTELFT